MNINIYVDTCVISAIVNEDWDPNYQDREAVKRIFNLYMKTLYVSLKTKEEIDNIKDQEIRKKALGIYNNLNKTLPIPTVSYGGQVRLRSGFSTQDLDRTKLRDLLAPRFQNKHGKQLTNDPDHVYYASKSNCNFFLTIDRELIRRYEKNKPEIDSIIGILKIVDPSRLVAH